MAQFFGREERLARIGQTQDADDINRLLRRQRAVQELDGRQAILQPLHAKAVITDSGGITEETTVLGVPCMTLRDSTERPGTVDIGTNALIGTDPAKLAPALARLFAGDWQRGGIPPLWDGRTGERIVAILERLATATGGAVNSTAHSTTRAKPTRP